MPNQDRIYLRGVPPELWHEVRVEMLRDQRAIGSLVTELLTKWLAERRQATGEK